MISQEQIKFTKSFINVGLELGPFVVIVHINIVQPEYLSFL